MKGTIPLSSRANEAKIIKNLATCFLFILNFIVLYLIMLVSGVGLDRFIIL